MFSVMNQATPECIALRALRMRAEDAIPRQFTNSELVKLSLACALRNPTQALGVLFGHQLLKEIRTTNELKGTSTLARMKIESAEFASLFAERLHGTGGHNLIQTSTSTEFCVSGCKALEETLGTTFVSPMCKASWQSPIVRVAATVALRMQDYEPMLTAVLGGDIARSDLRMLQSLQDDLQDVEDSNDAHILPLCDLVVALAGTIGE